MMEALHMRRRTLTHLRSLPALLVLHCGGDPQAPPADMAAPARRTLDKGLKWRGDNQARLDAMLAAQGSASAGYDPARRPLAIFDWDNTVIKNDAGDSTFYYLLKNSKVLQPPAKNWRLTSPYLSADAVTALKAACDALADPGQPLPTATDDRCATELISIYDSGSTTGKKAAFASWNYRRMEPAYAWLAQLLAGYTPEQVAAFAAAARMENLSNAVGAQQKIGTYGSVNHYARYYDQQKDLIGALQANGFDVWVVSASPQVVVEQWLDTVGVAKDHLIGIRSVVVNGKYTADLQGCGDVPDGSNDGMGKVTGNSMITYIEGKRCWINKIIHGDAGATAIDQRPAAQRHVFAAGDSDTDVEFLKDATVLKLVLNRNKKELMCHAYNNAGGHWLINPMFLDPRPQQASVYACATSACKSAAGQGVPCTSEDGKPIADQMDTVF